MFKSPFLWNKEDLQILTIVGKKIAPTDVHLLIPRTGDHVALPKKGELKQMDLRWLIS